MSHAWLDPEEVGRLARGMEEWFGVPPEVIEGYAWVRRGEALCALAPEARPWAEAYPASAVGLKAFKEVGAAGPKLTSRGAQVLGRWATRRVVDVGEEDLRGLVEGRSLPWDGPRGPVILRTQGVAVGMGVLRDGHLLGQLPRAVTEHLQFGQRGGAL